jgi:hypothetical protein
VKRVRLHLRNLFAGTRLYCPKDRYAIVSLRKNVELGNLLPRLEPFSSIAFEKDEVSLILKQNLWKKCSSHYEGSKVAGPYRLITFDITIDLDVCGYFAAISKLLAEANISIIPASTYLRDHILVNEVDCRKALRTINRFLKSQRE